MNWPLGRPVAVYGLKLRTNAGSPEPVMTRHLWAVVRTTEAGAAAPWLDAAAETVATASTARSAPAPTAAATSVRRRRECAERGICVTYLPQFLGPWRRLPEGFRRFRKCSGNG